jgi:hypothetical protein
MNWLIFITVVLFTIAVALIGCAIGVADMWIVDHTGSVFLGITFPVMACGVIVGLVVGIAERGSPN